MIRPEQILALKGDSERGRELFFKSSGLQCATCHRVHGSGGNLGPDLSDVAKKNSRGQLVESLLEPSKTIDPKYVTYVLATNAGQVHTGLLAMKTEREIILHTAGDKEVKEVRVPVDRVAALVPQKVSLMPEQLLRDLTAEQAADLLEYLMSLKGASP